MDLASTIVVADVFFNFAKQHEAVITYSELLRTLAASNGEQKMVVIPGQGMPIAALEDLAHEYPALQVLRPMRQLPRAGHKQAHKHRPQNIVVSLARERSPGSYELDLHFDAGNEFFQDHMTGQHIQGMAIMEAMRQSFLTVTEQFHLPDRTRAYYFVIHEMSIRFERFLFPLDARIDYQVVEQRAQDGRYRAQVEMRLLQAGEVCATGAVGFTAFDAALIESREHTAAEKMLASYLKQMETALHAPSRQPARQRTDASKDEADALAAA